ncbi:MAG: cyclic nucleotide-binding domain-containing protein, partial [Nitrospira sp.]|nr:cyclic nucleotide-binding domain-containing protein [Nitrospira sp.]
MHQLTSSDLMAFLSSTELLGGLDKSILKDLKTELKLARIRSGKILIRQGDVGDCLYIVLNGRLRVSSKHENGDEEILGEVGRGQSVGEMAILNDELRSATVRAIQDTELVKFSKEGFNRLMEKYPQAMRQVTQIITTRFQSSALRRFRPSSTELVAFLASTELLGALDES